MAIRKIDVIDNIDDASDNVFCVIGLYKEYKVPGCDSSRQKAFNNIGNEVDLLGR